MKKLKNIYNSSSQRRSRTWRTSTRASLPSSVTRLTGAPSFQLCSSPLTPTTWIATTRYLWILNLIIWYPDFLEGQILNDSFQMVPQMPKIVPTNQKLKSLDFKWSKTRFHSKCMLSCFLPFWNQIFPDFRSHLKTGPFGKSPVVWFCFSIKCCYETIMFGRVTFARRRLRRERFSVYRIPIL